MLDPVLIRRDSRIRNAWKLRSHLLAAERLAGFLAAVRGTDYSTARDELAALPRAMVVRHLRKARLETRARRLGPFAGVVRHGRLRCMHLPGAGPDGAFGLAEPAQTAALPHRRDPAVSSRSGPPGPPGPADPETLPGMAEARDYLRRVTGGRGNEAPDSRLRSVRPTPDQALNALMILQLARALSGPGRDLQGLCPEAGTITVLHVPCHEDRTRLAALLAEILPKGRAHVLHEGDAGNRTRLDDLPRQIEAVLLTGLGVIAILSGDAALSDRLRPLAMNRLSLARLDGEILTSLWRLLYPSPEIALEASDPGLGRLRYTHLLPVLAAPDGATAHARLARVIAATASGGDVTLEAVHGQDEAVSALRQVVTDLEGWRNGRIDWAEVTRSFLLFGPPGTGKTLLAQALAGSAGIALVKTSYSECQAGGHQGDMLRALHAAGAQAIARAPAVFFIDEIDSFYGRDRSRDGYIVGVVNGLLTLIDRLLATPGVLLLGASNDIGRIDPAVIRAGRFDRHIRMGPPNRDGIREMLRAGLPAALAEAAAAGLADALLGLTGAEIAALLREARTRARAARRDLALPDVVAAADARLPRHTPGLLWRVAVHEAGHVFAGHLLGLEPPTRVRISARGGQVLRPAPALLTQATIPARLQMQLAGRAAEALFFEAVSSGGGGGDESDLARATQLALMAEACFGFGPTLAWYPAEQPLMHMPRDLRNRVEARLGQAQTEVMALLADFRPELRRLAEALHAARELEAAALERLLAPVPKRVPKPAPVPCDEGA